MSHIEYKRTGKRAGVPSGTVAGVSKGLGAGEWGILKPPSGIHEHPIRGEGGYTFLILEGILLNGTGSAYLRPLFVELKN